jgi:hypothetical protein
MDIQAQIMTKKETKLCPPHKDFKKLYPHRDRTLASNIIQILVMHSRLSSKGIRIKLSSMGSGHTHRTIETALDRLKEIGCITKVTISHKSQIDNMWELSCLGNIVALTILQDDELYSFIDQHKEDKFYKIIDVLIKSSKKDFVKLLIRRIYENDQLKIESTALDWYNDMRLKISKIDASRYPELVSLQEKIKRDGFEPMVTKRGFPVNSMWTETRLDRIC